MSVTWLRGSGVRKDQLDKLQSRMAELEMALAGERAEAASEEEIIKCASEVKGLLDSGSISERRSFIKSYVKEIRITGDEARLTQTLPMLPGGNADEAVPVLGIEQSGGRYWARTSDLCDVNAVL